MLIMSNGQEAVKVGRNAYKRYPDNYYIGLKYAMALCESGQYMASLNCLKKLQVLPYEGIVYWT